MTFYLSINQVRPVGDDAAEFIELPDRPDVDDVEPADRAPEQIAAARLICRRRRYT